MIGDGNCLFRAFSWYFNGSQDEHMNEHPTPSLGIYSQLARGWRPKLDAIHDSQSGKVSIEAMKKFGAYGDAKISDAFSPPGIQIGMHAYT